MPLSFSMRHFVSCQNCSFLDTNFCKALCRAVGVQWVNAAALSLIQERDCVDIGGRPKRLASRFEIDEVSPQVKFQLVIIWLHMPAQLIEGFAVLVFLDVRKFVNNDHTQKFKRHLLEQFRYADLTLGSEFCALYPRDAGVRAQCVLNDMKFAVERDLAQLPGIAQIPAFNFQHIVIERLVGAHSVRMRILLQQCVGQQALFDKPLHLLYQCYRVASKIIWRRFCAHSGLYDIADGEILAICVCLFIDPAR